MILDIGKSAAQNAADAALLEAVRMGAAHVVIAVMDAKGCYWARWQGVPVVLGGIGSLVQQQLADYAFAAVNAAGQQAVGAPAPK